MTNALLPDEYFDDLLVRMAHHSTAIEGNTLTQGETKTMFIFTEVCVMAKGK